MKANTSHFLPLWASLVWLATPAAHGQAPAPAADAPKPPVHKADQSALNRLKQDDRAKKELSEVIGQLRDTAKRSENAGKEIKRVNAKDLKEDPGKVIDSVKDTLSPEDTAGLKAAMEKAKAALNSEDAKKVIEEAKNKAAATASKAKPATTTPPEKFGPATFDKVPAPVPVMALAMTPKPRTPGFTVDGKSIIFPPSRDPANPERVLPASDPRSRTYVVTGNAQVKTPNMVLDADRIEMIASVEGGGINAPQSAKKPARTKPGDPVQPGAGETGEENKPAPFDRVMADSRVNLVRLINGKTQTGKGGSMIYDKKSGTMILTDWPQAHVDGNLIIGKSKDAKIILVPDGEPRTENCRIEGYEQPAAPSKPPAAAPAGRPAPRAKVVP